MRRSPPPHLRSIPFAEKFHVCDTGTTLNTTLFRVCFHPSGLGHKARVYR